ncbi:protein serine/threonine phosphatase 2C [Trametes cingulata]|nr:protein serine/threonine phosphatase 2C [Trametes cingulata]
MSPTETSGTFHCVFSPPVMSECTTPELEEARRNVIEAFRCTKESGTPTVHTVTFAPLGPRTNADRLASERWDIQGQQWLFLAVCDGHIGTATSEYTIRTLPGKLRTALERTLEEKFKGSLERSNLARIEQSIGKLLCRETYRFDLDLARAVKELCPDPRKMSEEEIRLLIEQHGEVFQRALEGTTLAMALVNLDLRVVWGASVGDSTIALSTKDKEGVHRGRKFCHLHSFKNPREYYETVMRHSSAEKNIVDQHDKILGWLSLSRAIGDHCLKMPRVYTSRIFQHLPSHRGLPFSALLSRLHTPPYISAEPSLRFIDLDPFWSHDPTILVYSDGVDNIVDGAMVFTPNVSSKWGPLFVLPSLLPESARVSSGVEHILGHPVEVGWSREDANMAVDILGNLLGGRDAKRLTMVMDRELLTSDSQDVVFHIDDVTIIVARLTA